MDKTKGINHHLFLPLSVFMLRIERLDYMIMKMSPVKTGVLAMPKNGIGLCFADIEAKSLGQEIGNGVLRKTTNEMVKWKACNLGSQTKSLPTLAQFGQQQLLHQWLTQVLREMHLSIALDIQFTLKHLNDLYLSLWLFYMYLFATIGCMH
ncbi:unnamed protein product [Lactuca saligna]|uniref:Uncharacterized protein n=1 Tax=Lactuca saligna TaxID=75948 RepID=A0AA35YMK7_LACSI|nr:unnamed protein product [Lactuca saligna]